MSEAAVSAPGKLMVSGEYAVLFGAPAIVAAVDRRAVASWTDDTNTSLRPEALASRRFAEQLCGEISQGITIDVMGLHSKSKKLGLGSSAASAVAAAALVFNRHGHDVSNDDVREKIFSCAYQGHKSIASEGSGADVAASAYGGFIHFELNDGTPIVRPLTQKSGMVFKVVYTGHPARTSDLVAKVRKLNETNASRFEELLAQLTRDAKSFVRAWNGDSSCLPSIRAYQWAMRSLGEAAQANIVEEHLQAIANIAEIHNGAAKPSGAGGGDVALAAFLTSTSAERFSDACTEAGYESLDLQLALTASFSLVEFRRIRFRNWNNGR